MNVFITLPLKQVFWKIETFKNWSSKFTIIENATFPYKSVLSNTNVESNRIGSTKWNYAKQTFATSYFIFLEKLISVSKYL